MKFNIIENRMNNFIDNKILSEILLKTQNPDNNKINEILQKALELNGLNLDDAAYLINIHDNEQLENLFETAKKIKDEIYGSRLVLFAPLYISNYCSNNCLYCGFRSNNKQMNRTILNQSEIENETISILEQGHKRILLLMGESGSLLKNDYFFNSIETIYRAKDSKGSSIRRINVEIAPLDKEELIKLSSVPIGTYTVFQETYHNDTYKIMHPSGPKSDFENRLFCMDRALQNGLHDVGIGALFGLYDYRFEVLGLLSHAKHLDENYNVGPHTISVPRLKPASNAPASLDETNSVSDINFMKLISVLRCSVPYTGMILSTRESAELRTKIYNLGISQLSAGSRTNPGGYKGAFDNSSEEGQFSLNDCRTSGEVIKDVIKHGFIPSFCTAC